MNKTRILSESIYAVVSSTHMEPLEVLATLALVVYKVTLVQAVMAGVEPSVVLAKFIETLEEHFGEYIEDPKTKQLRAIAAALFGPAD